MFPVLGLVGGLVIGALIPYNISSEYSKYVAVAILAALDSVFGAVTANLQKKFDFSVFISGFFGNAALAAGLAYVGDRLGMELYLAAVFAFGNRLFLNFAIMRRILLSESTKKENIGQNNLS